MALKIALRRTEDFRDVNDINDFHGVTQSERYDRTSGDHLEGRPLELQSSMPALKFRKSANCRKVCPKAARHHECTPRFRSGPISCGAFDRNLPCRSPSFFAAVSASGCGRRGRERPNRARIRRCQNGQRRSGFDRACVKTPYHNGNEQFGCLARACPGTFIPPTATSGFGNCAAGVGVRGFTQARPNSAMVRPSGRSRKRTLAPSRVAPFVLNLDDRSSLAPRHGGSRSLHPSFLPIFNRFPNRHS
jgi:hypothetical protein